MKERIIQIIQKEGLSNAEFAERIGVSVSSLSHIFNGRNNPSLELVMRIHKACPYVNLNWLLYGEGQMEDKKPAGGALVHPRLPGDVQKAQRLLLLAEKFNELQQFFRGLVGDGSLAPFLVRLVWHRRSLPDRAPGMALWSYPLL